MDYTPRLRAMVERLRRAQEFISGRWDKDYALGGREFLSRLSEEAWHWALHDLGVQPRFGRYTFGEWSPFTVNPQEVGPPPTTTPMAVTMTDIGLRHRKWWAQLLATADHRLWLFDADFAAWWKSGELYLYQLPHGPALVIREQGRDRDYIMGMRVFGPQDMLPVMSQTYPTWTTLEALGTRIAWPTEQPEHKETTV